MSVWDESTVDWSTGEGLRLLQLLERAYGDRPAAIEVSELVGLDWPETAATASHEDLWAALLTSAAAARLVPAFADRLLEDGSREAFAEPMRRLVGDHVGLVEAARVARLGLPQAASEKVEVLDRMGPAAAAAALVPPAEAGQLEANNLAGRGSEDDEAYVESMLSARRRVALVRRGLAPVGSGFLVGRDLLVTAAHVLRSGGPPADGDLDNVDVVMDYLARGAASAQTGTPVPVRELLRFSPATEAEWRGGQLADWDAPEDQLDFALLRLGLPVGEDMVPDTFTRRRGWFDLSVIEPDLKRSAQVTVLHFPAGRRLARSWMEGEFQFNPSGTKTRMRYRSNTEPGSSGAPIFDEHGHLLAMHHYGLQPANQAVPIWRIAAAVADLLDHDQGPPPPPAPAAATTPRPSLVLDVGGKPVVDRGPWRGKLWEAMTERNVARSLVVVGTPDSGVSWSWWLVQHLAAEARTKVHPELKDLLPMGAEAIQVDLRQWINKSVEERRAALVRLIGRRLGRGEVAEEWVAQAAREVSDFKEWCYQRLPAEGPQWWIFVDSIDEPGDVDRNGSGEILAALVDLADDQQLNLRLVLAGRRADKIDHGSLSFATPDTPVGLTREEVRTWLVDKAEQTGRVLVPGRLDDWLAQRFPTSTSTPDPVQLTQSLLAGVKEVSDERVG